MSYWIVPHKVKRAFVGIGGKAKRILRGYTGVDGKAEIFYTHDKYPGILTLSDYSAVWDDTGFTKTITVLEASGTVSISVADPSVATAVLSGNTITITYIGAGNTDITVTSAETGEYTRADKTIAVEVVKRAGVLILSNYEPGGAYGESFETEVLQATGLVSVTSSDPSIVSVSISGNIITANYIDVGTAVITVTSSETEFYYSTSVNLNVVVSKLEGNVNVNTTSIQRVRNIDPVNYTIRAWNATGPLTFSMDDPSIATYEYQGEFFGETILRVTLIANGSTTFRINVGSSDHYNSTTKTISIDVPWAVQSDSLALSRPVTENAATNIGQYGIFAGGGTSNGSLIISGYSNSVDAYTNGGSKSNVPALSSGRYGLAGAQNGSYALFGGGYNGYDGGFDAYNSSLSRTAATGTAKLYCTGINLGNYALFAGGDNTDTVVSYDQSLTKSIITSLSATQQYTVSAKIGSYALISGSNVNVDVYDESLTKTIATNKDEAGDKTRSTAESSNYACFLGSVSTFYNSSLTKSLKSISNWRYQKGKMLDGYPFIGNYDSVRMLDKNFSNTLAEFRCNSFNGGSICAFGGVVLFGGGHFDTGGFISGVFMYSSLVL